MSHPLAMLRGMTNSELDSVIAGIARLRHGVFSRCDVLSAGGTDQEIRARLRSGRWTQLAEGVYGLASHPRTWQQRVEVARSDAGPGAFACRSTAAVLHKFNDFRPGKPHVLVASGRTNHSGIALVHQSRTLQRIDTTVAQGIPCTTPERTVIDLAAKLSYAHLDRVVESELMSKTVKGSRLGERFLALAGPGRPGLATLRSVLDVRLAHGYEPLASELEALLLRRLIENGLPIPTRQFHLPWRQPENGWVDFAYLIPRVILEADGRNWHTRLEQMANDRRRDREVQLHGYDLYRYTWDELQDEPGLVAELLPLVTAR
jgi:hypothetical protein